jgi:nicotinate phosphoribosyltransferase
MAAGDVLSLTSDAVDGEPLLVPVIRAGRLVEPQPVLEAARAHARDALTRLAAPLRGLESAAAYPVAVAPSLRALAAELDARN